MLQLVAEVNLEPSLPELLVSTGAIRAVALLSLTDGDSTAYMGLLRSALEVGSQWRDWPGLVGSGMLRPLCTACCCLATCLGPWDLDRLLMSYINVNVVVGLYDTGLVLWLHTSLHLLHAPACSVRFTGSDVEIRALSGDNGGTVMSCRGCVPLQLAGRTSIAAQVRQGYFISSADLWCPRQALGHAVAVVVCCTPTPTAGRGAAVRLMYFRCRALRWCKSFRLGSSSSLLLHTRTMILSFNLATHI